VDKIFIATIAYDKEGNVIREKSENADDAEYDEAKALGNELLLNYIDLISDIKNYANSRASIDVVTDLLLNGLVNPILRNQTDDYVHGMEPLLPSFQARKKMEFSTGKDGIGPFALNITNLALTQFSHLTMNYGNDAVGNGGYDLGDLYQITGQDGQRISDWLSAMVNAHVDVAKDPYIFHLNINKVTYKYVNFLLRAGKGISTFTLISQPLIKKYTNKLITSGGIYGTNLDLDNQSSEVFNSVKQQARNKVVKGAIRQIRAILAQNSKILDENTIVNAKEAIKYFELMTMSKG